MATKIDAEKLNEKITKQGNFKAIKSSLFNTFFIPLVLQLIPFFISLVILGFKEKNQITPYYYGFKHWGIHDFYGSIINDSIQTSNILKNWYSLDIELVNTGRKSLTKESFQDGAIKIIVRNIDCQNKVQFLGVMCLSNQNGDLCKKETSKDSLIISYTPTILNRKDKVTFKIFSNETTTFDIQVRGKIPNGTIIQQPKLKHYKSTFIYYLKKFKNEIEYPKLFGIVWTFVSFIFLLMAIFYLKEINKIEFHEIFKIGVVRIPLCIFIWIAGILPVLIIMIFDILLFTC